MNANRADSAPLSIRILDSFPAGEYALSALLRITSIVETDMVPTAAVECVAAPRLLINPKFVEERAETPEKLLMLVMHELHHVLLGHTTLFPRATKIDNFVFDAIINALLCRMFSSPEHLSFFTGMYREESFPECLLRPPSPTWKLGSETIPAALRIYDMRAIREVYRALYSPKGASYDEVYNIFREKVRSVDLGGVVLIGGHEGEEGEGGVKGIVEDGVEGTGVGSDDGSSEKQGGGADNADDSNDGAAGGKARPLSAPGVGVVDPLYGGLQQRSPALFEAVREIVEKWPQPPDPIAGRSLASILRVGKLKVKRAPTWRAILRKALLKVCDRKRAGRGHVQLLEERRTIETPLPMIDRRAIVQRSLGLQPMLYRSSIDHTRRRRTGEKVHVYLDVSGSIGNLARPLYGAVLDCRRFVHDRVHLFSTEIADVTLAELRRGKISSTGGTDIRCVARHMEENGIRRAVIITDGFVGEPRGAHLNTLRRAKVSVVLTPGFARMTDLEEISNYSAALPEDKLMGGIR